MKAQIKYRSGYKYQLEKELELLINVRQKDNIITRFICLSPRGFIQINRGYCWDGPSGPLPDRKRLMRAALVHDALYQLHRSGLLPQEQREASDAAFRDICIEDGIPAWRARIYYWGLRRFGARFASTENRKPVLTAP